MHTTPDALKVLFKPSTRKHIAFDLDYRGSAAEELLKESARSQNVEQSRSLQC
jgi:hypothetical protein